LAGRQGPRRWGYCRSPTSCLAAASRARRPAPFFCDYVQEYLSRAGISKDQVARGGYLIRTTLDPDVQIPVKTAIDKFRQSETCRASRA